MPGQIILVSCCCVFNFKFYLSHSPFRYIKSFDPLSGTARFGGSLLRILDV